MATSRRTFLTGAASLALCGGGLRRAFAAGNGRPPRNLVIFFAHGGWDPALALDPKPGVATVAVQPGGVERHHGHDVYVMDAAPEVGSFFAAHGAETAIMRGVDMVSLSHEICRRYALTGSVDLDVPDLGAIVAATHGTDRALPYLIMSSRAMPGPLSGISGWLGSRNQLGALLNPAEGPAPLPELGLPTDAASERVAQWIRERHERMGGYTSTRGQLQYADFGAGQERVAALEANRESFQGFATLDVLDNQVEMAVQALQNGLVRAVHLDSGSSWDTHYDNAIQERYYAKMFGSLDRLVTLLKTTPGPEGGTLLDETVVWVASEMGRTPGLNEGYGKEHLPFTSAMLIGAGVKGGQTFGATDDALVGHKVNLATGALDDGGSIVRPDQLVAGVLEGCGVDSSEWFTNVTPYLGPFQS